MSTHVSSSGDRRDAAQALVVAMPYHPPALRGGATYHPPALRGGGATYPHALSGSEERARARVRRVRASGNRS